jgi:hypothetical protein
VKTVSKNSGIQTFKEGETRLLAIGSLNTQQTTEQEVVDFDLSVDRRQLTTVTQNETNETISTAQGRVDESSNTDETTGNGELEGVLLGEERLDAGVDRTALNLSVGILGNETRTDLDLVLELDDSVQDRTTGNTSLQLIDFGTRLVDVEGTDDLNNEEFC